MGPAVGGGFKMGASVGELVVGLAVGMDVGDAVGKFGAAAFNAFRNGVSHIQIPPKEEPSHLIKYRNYYLLMLITVACVSTFGVWYSPLNYIRCTVCISPLIQFNSD